MVGGDHFSVHFFHNTDSKTREASLSYSRRSILCLHLPSLYASNMNVREPPGHPIGYYP